MNGAEARSASHSSRDNPTPFHSRSLDRRRLRCSNQGILARRRCLSTHPGSFADFSHHQLIAQNGIAAMDTKLRSRLVRSANPHPACWLMLAALAVSILTPLVAWAQPPRDQRRELVEGLLRTFLEAQIEKNLRPDRPAPPPQAIPADLVKAREALSGFAREANQLYELLQAESVRNATARQYLPEMMRVAAQAGVLAERSSRIYDVQSLGREFRDLDRQWRLLSYRLDQADGLSRLCGPGVRRLDGFAAALGQLCGIQPQTDYRELLRQTDALNSDLQRLVDEIEIGLGRSRDAQVLQLHGRRIQQQVRLLANLIAQQTSRAAIVAEFHRYQQLWQPFAASLWPLGQRNLERTLRNLEETDRQIHELLWLPVPINRQHLQHLTEVLMNRVDELLDGVTLRVLMELRGAPADAAAHGQPVAAAAVFGGEVPAVFQQGVCGRRIPTGRPVSSVPFVVGKIVASGGVHQPQTRFDGCGGTDRTGQVVGIVLAQGIRPGATLDGIQRPGHQHFGPVRAVLHLQHLDGELDVHRAARPAFQIRLGRRLLQP
jgi:hypothetical protein